MKNEIFIPVMLNLIKAVFAPAVVSRVALSTIKLKIKRTEDL
jgi:hypothetical protein